MDEQNQHSNDSNTKTSRDKLKPLVVLALFLLLIAELLGSSCFISSIFGIPCAGCGSTRAVKLLLHGKILDALRMHPLIFITLLLLVVIPTFTIARFVAKKKR